MLRFNYKRVDSTKSIMEIAVLKKLKSPLKNIHETFQFTHKRIKIGGREFIGEVIITGGQKLTTL
jgi:hypothetical protein